jgi:hypothetical protein
MTTKRHGWITALLLMSALAPSAIAQSQEEQYVPKLGDIMNAAQTRHIPAFPSPM